jgi:hypothetical protein
MQLRWKAWKYFFVVMQKLFLDLQMAHQQDWHQFRENAQSDITKQPRINIHPRSLLSINFCII